MARRDRKGRKLRPRTRAERAAKPVEPNIKVQQRRAAFAVFQGGKADNEVHDAPGQAWAAGLFDGQPADPIAIRDAARDYGNLYWYWYSEMLPKSPNMERSAKGMSSAETTSRERRFQKMDSTICVHSIRNAVHALCVDYWGSDEAPPWLQRCINSKLADMKKPVAGYLARPEDLQRMKLAIKGLLGMVRGNAAKAA